MDDKEISTPADTQVTVSREPANLSIGDSLRQQFKNVADENGSDNTTDKTTEPTKSESVAVEKVEPPTPLAPPADMNAAEKEAFLNPTAANAHILQSYLNRRAYETRSDYSRKMQEVEQLKKHTSGLYETIKQYEDEYAREGLSINDVTRQAIAWDRAMQKDPISSAIDWLDAYGLTVNDLLQKQQTQPQQAPQYLTREEAERIAEERYQKIQSEQQKKAVDYYNQQVVTSFMNNKPLFRDPETASQLEAEMAPVVQALNATGRYSSPEQVLETAYNYVVNGNPTFSGLVQKMTAKPVIEQQQAVVQKAKQAAKSISGSAGSGTPRVQSKSLGDNLRRRFIGE